jgi:hypothetical protein
LIFSRISISTFSGLIKALKLKEGLACPNPNVTIKIILVINCLKNDLDISIIIIPVL